MIEIIRKLFRLFPPGELRQLKFMAPAIVGMSLMQVAGIGSILPFLAVVADPTLIQRHKILSALQSSSGISSTTGFLLLLGTGSFMVLLVGNVVTALVKWWMVRFSEMRTHFLASVVLKSHLDQPYAHFLGSNSSDVGVRVLADVVQIVSGILMPGLQLAAQAVMSAILLAFLFVVNPVLSLVVFVGLGGLYLAVYSLIRGQLSRVGKQRAAADAEQFRALAEASGAIKEIKLHHLEQFFLERFQRPNLIMARAHGRQAVLSETPHYAMETIAFGGILGVVLYFLATDKSVLAVLPVLGIYGYSILRIKPALQQIYSSVAQMRFNKPVLDRVYDELYSRRVAPATMRKAATVPEVPLRLDREIRLDAISFRYPGAPAALFDGLELSIEANSSVAFVGTTGSGKSTLVDIILGLLVPDRGSLTVDGAQISDLNRHSWQKNVSYVPQHIYLADDTLARNIAFGVQDSEIDLARVAEAARLARIEEFISSELPSGYDTSTGERGVRLSGGQRQRIGIARALYRDAQLLVLDEATSALDALTEESVFDSIRELSRKKTIIVVAHRLSTIRECDRIFLLDGGRIVASGQYDELLETSAQFRAMTRSVPKRAALRA